MEGWCTYLWEWKWIKTSIQRNIQSNNTDSTLYIDIKGPNGTFYFSNKFSGFHVVGYSTGQFRTTPTNSADINSSLNTNSINNLYVYHERNSYTLTFLDSFTNNQLETQNVLYEESLSGHKYNGVP